MANEKRLIDANALLAELDKFVNPMPDTNGLHFLGGLSTAITEIENAPTVDAVEVVRCKDCFYNANGCCTHSEPYDDTRYRPDYFCADGYRKES